MPSDPSEGVFFVLRLPKGWQLCTCRHDEYGPLGLPDFWVEALGPFLNIWLSHFLERGRHLAQKRHAAIERALGLIVAGYDAFPRGEIKRGEERNQFVIRHGGELSRALRVSRREVEDERLASARESAQRLRKLLAIKEHWERSGATRTRRISLPLQKKGR
jgi:hypothetical protein